MLRILAVIVWIAVTVYAIADWSRTPEEELPARIPKAMWLVLIIVTIPSFSLGAIAWIVVRAVARSEAGQSPLPPIPSFPGPRAPKPQAAPPAPSAPDDDPYFLFRLERDIQRERRSRAERDARRGDSAPSPDTGAPSADASSDAAAPGSPSGSVGEGPADSQGDTRSDGPRASDSRPSDSRTIDEDGAQTD